MPVLRYRREEIKALKSVKLSGKTMPLLEIVTELAGLHRKGDFKSTYLEDFKAFNFDFMVDIPVYLGINKNTKPKVKEFISKFKQDPDLCVDYLEKLKDNRHVIPVISYDPKTRYQSGFYIKAARNLRASYDRLGFRIFNAPGLVNVLDEVIKVIISGDILIFDLDTGTHFDTSLFNKYRMINALKNIRGYTTVLLGSAINPDIVFKDMVDGAVEQKADNSLLRCYSRYGFDCFGDYVGVRKDKTLSGRAGGVKSAGFLFYSWNNNSYIGFRGREPDYNEFLSYIKPKLLASQYWNQFSAKHHEVCPGCLTIRNNAAIGPWDWKRYSIQHYLYTMEENL